MALSFRPSRLFIAVASVALTLSSLAIANSFRNVLLRPGESYTFSDGYRGDIIVYCGTGTPPGGPGYPPPPPPPPPPGFPPPPPPGYPGTPTCSTFELDGQFQRLTQRRDRLARGECGYRRADGFQRCEGLLDRNELQNQKARFQRDLLDLKLSVENLCRSRTCSQFEISRIVRDYDGFLHSVQFSRIVYEARYSVPFIDFPEQFRLNCSSW